MSDFVKNFDFDVLKEFDDLDDFTLSQVLDKYEVSECFEENISFGSFEVELPEERPTENTRFGPPVDSKYIQDFINSKENKNTRKNTNWANGAWNEWTKSRGDVPGLLTMNALQLNHYLSCFVIECRRQYPGNSLYQIVTGILRYSRENGVISMNFLDTGDLRFQGFHSETGSDRSLYDLYELYLEKVGKTGTFYRRPMQEKEIKFSRQVVGVNKLSTIVKTMWTVAGIQGNVSNHSGKRTCATSLFQNGVDEQLIMQRTGHRNTAGRDYKRTSSAQEKEISSLLEPPSKKCKVPSVDVLSVFGASDTSEIKTETQGTGMCKTMNFI